MNSVLPAEMTAIEIASPGGPEVLRPCRRPVPQPCPGEVLIRVKAAGVNRPDLMQRRGLYPPPPGASDLPGLEVAGTIVRLGPETTGVSLGDEVCALLSGGGYAEYAIAAATLCLPVPVPLTAVQAAAIPETFFTVWTNLLEQAQLKAGQRLLVHGGAGGIGTVAVQLARAFGIEVFATAGSAEKCDFCASLGARAINYRTEDFVARVKQETGGAGVDVVLDMIGGSYLQRNLECLATGGRLVVIAVQGGPKGEINLLPVFLKHLTLTGSTLRPRSVAEKSRIAAGLRERVWPLLASGKVAPVVTRTFPLAEAADAHRWMEGGGHRGKIVLVVE